jgi:hypothetical protein
MVWLAVLLTVAFIVLWVYAFFDALTTPAPEVRNLPKPLWVLMVLFLMHVGALLWLIWGRPRADTVNAPTPSPRPGIDGINSPGAQGSASKERPIGPDDDPDFLRDINRRINPDD